MSKNGCCNECGKLGDDRKCNPPDDNKSCYQNPNKLIKGKVMVEWTELGEGIQGDYDANDPDDVELLRFDISKKVSRSWEAMDDASYCTQIPVTATAQQRFKLLETIMSHVYDNVTAGKSIKRICEELSWLSLDSLKSDKIERKYIL